MMSGYHSFAQAYDALIAQQIDYSAMAKRVCQLISNYKGTRSLVLDLACGSGSLALELMRMGSDVIGVDSSPEQLMIAREKLSLNGFSPLLLCQDMTELDLYGTVEAVVCTMDSLNHLESGEQFACALSRAALFLEPGGLLLFDLNTVYKHRCVLADHTFVYDSDPFYCVWQNEYQADQDRVQIDLDLFIHEKGTYRREQEQFAELAYPHEVVVDMLKQAGCSLLACYDGYEEQLVSDTTERILYIARKHP